MGLELLITMSNPYEPPKAHVEDRSRELSKEHKRVKSAVRPLGVVLVVALFFIFSAASAVLLAAEGDWWWIVHVAITCLLAWWFRKLWWGDERERKIAVFLGFFIAALTVLGGPEGSVADWTASELTSLAEGCYALLAACYLIYARKHPFFAGPRET